MSVIDAETGEINEGPSAPAGQMNLIGLLHAASNGGFLADADDELKRVAAKMKEIAINENRDCKGEITIKIKLTTKANALAYACEVAAKPPGPAPKMGLAFADDEGHLFKQDPDQPVMNFDRSAAFTRKPKR
jgi:hypothetical protein